VVGGVLSCVEGHESGGITGTTVAGEQNNLFGSCRVERSPIAVGGASSAPLSTGLSARWEYDRSSLPIRELDETVVRQIAAGEVVERPASAVKELVENSLDADASRLDVAVAAGGTEGIRVADDGVGMTREEVRLAVEEHTTSKIADADDLDAISTLGFRGEALYAIGSVSRTTVTTRPRGGEDGTELTVEFGDVVEVAPAGRPEGTTIEVTDLFANTPARRKFLKTEATEFDHVNRVVSRYALANPGVAVSLTHGDREVFATTGQGDLEGALLAVYGREVAESMIPVNGEGVSGYVSHPETNRSTREYLATYVNGRYVTAGALREPIVEAYGHQLASDRYPFAVLFVDVPPAAIDVNVHPRKMEVRFDDEAAVRERVEAAVASALVEHGLIRSGAPRGKSAAAEADVRPESQTDGAQTGTSASDHQPAPSVARPSKAEGAASAGGTVDTATPEDRSRGWRPGDFADADEVQTTLEAGAVEAGGEYESLPALRVLGQLHDTYVVAETDEGLVLIDQHAADERVNYERLRERFADEPGSQALAEPVSVELTARESELFAAHEAALESLGFRAESAADRTVEVHAVPAVFSEALPPDLLRDVLAEIVRERSADSVEERADALLADLACYPSITGNTPLTEGSVSALLSALDDCENPYACPHGRPVIVEIDAEELGARFERDYPGHPGRRLE